MPAPPVHCAAMQGQLFTQDFLRYGIRQTPAYQALDDAALERLRSALQAIFAPLRADSTLNEAQTEQLVIEQVLAELGWGSDYLPQVNLSGKRREDVPDILLFADAQAMQAARAEARDDRRCRHGLAILEAKRWMRALDRGDDSESADPGAPSSQMLRYLSRAEVVSDRAIQWGLLTNGALWRLYWQNARSRAEEFLEIDLALALGVPGVPGELDGMAPEHTLRLFFVLFNRAAFLGQSWDTANRSLHAYALNEARLYEEAVSKDLGARVFTEIFPSLAQALAAGDLHARRQKVGYGQFTRQQYTREYLDEVREAALILLYRLLFLFYAEDRNLLPVRDPRYHAYSVRRLRERVRDEVNAGKVFSTRLDNIWRDLQGVFLLLDEGDDAVGMPAYNGGLFERARAAAGAHARARRGDGADHRRAVAPHRRPAARLDQLPRPGRVAPGRHLRTPARIHAGARGAGRRRLPRQVRDRPHQRAAGELCAQGLGQLLHARRSGAADPARIGRPAGGRAHAGLRGAAQEVRAQGLAEPGRLGSTGQARPGRAHARTQGLRPGHGQRPLPGGAGRRPGRPRAGSRRLRRASGRRAALGRASGRARPPVAEPGGGARRRHPQDDSRHGARAAGRSRTRSSTTATSCAA